jgi:alpha-beta hydrolase superfamily lysophospholipase
MLYKFKSQAAGDLIMLEPNGRRVLEIMGKDAGPTGIILPEQMPAAINALTAAITREEAEQQAAIADAKAKGGVVPRFEAISLRKRAWPLVEMLQRCAKENAPVTWGV